MKILIVKLSAIGDVIHTLPALNALRRHFPQAEITWLVERAAADLVVGHPALDRVIVSHRKQWIQALKHAPRRPTWRRIRRFVKDLRDTRYDLVLDFQALLKSGAMIALTRSGEKVGFGKGMAHMEHSYWFLNRRLPAVSMEHHALVRNLMMIEALGVDCRRIEYRLPIGQADLSAVEALLQHSPDGDGASRPLVAINPMAKWESKLWRADGFAAVADAVKARYGARVVFTGSAADRPAVADIMARMQRPALNLCGATTLKQLAALYGRCRLLVSTDTGPMHLAAAMNTPLVALFGPTAPWRTGPYGSGHQIVRAPGDCGPCFKRICPQGGCMTAITTERVLAGVDRIMHSADAATGRSGYPHGR